jgi:hypothetical protein
MVRPLQVRFIQNYIRPVFQCRLHTVHATESALRNSELPALRITPIRIFMWHVNVHTGDNRRLYAFQQSGVSLVPAKWVPLVPVDRSKFTTLNGGVSVQIRLR